MWRGQKIAGQIDENAVTSTDSKRSLYVDPRAMEPLLPDYGQTDLAELTAEILRKSGKLSAQVPVAIVRERIANLVREMNSYYSNLIEGHKTLPRDIERALREDFSSNPIKRTNQQLNRAHIEVERLMTERLRKEPALSIHSIEFLSWLHCEFYDRLPDGLHISEDHGGRPYRIVPGTLRHFEVEVGRHQPPHFGALANFLQRFEQFYSNSRNPATNQLVALAAAHHRLTWIHPFGDGNGRVARLHSHAWLIRIKTDSFGLWTLSRGLARHRKQYYEYLSEADKARWNDHDGRSNLSDRALGEFALFFLRVMLDQINFMSELLRLQNLSARIEHHLRFAVMNIPPRMKERLARLLKAALIEGEIERGKVAEIVGLRETSARDVIRTALSEKLVDSPSPKGRLCIVFSADTLENYFPQLYQDLPIEKSTGM